MYSLTIQFGAAAWSFAFKDRTEAESYYGKASDAIIGGHPFTVSDNFGQSATFQGGTASGALLEDTELSNEARIVRGLDQIRAQARANKRASTDPELQALSRQQGPSIISPMGPNGFSRQ